MSVTNCYLNGSFTSAEKATIPISDLGFIHGVTVTEQLRSFCGRPLLYDAHFDRFEKGLQLVGITLNESRQRWQEIAFDLCQKHFSDCKLDCGLGMFATPGSTNRFGIAHGPQFCLYTYPLPETEYSDYRNHGIQLNIPEVVDVSETSFPKDVKIRSRLHYYLADRFVAAKQQAAGSATNRKESYSLHPMAILVDDQGNIRDTSIAAPALVFEPKTLTIPPRESILESVSLDFVCRLAKRIELKVDRREIHRSEIDQVRAMFLTNSLFCLAPVQSISGHELAIDSNEYSQLAEEWQKETGIKF